ncbi:HEAT repeat domain-containing protein [Bradyrhizobium diazoefficiens]|uniref:HEAT repeat domain-containing protein n=1 Tax=Bradyrhizobium diazoefficiens TaxID=1355477 RepID=UPI00190DAA60|nr:HEAT repeat domain-containing protein [Bradyrhizobium diazoefficiens]QQO33190.1 HEAT repeat domain-containing protein [Bradyrhizobium diazoefficiens]
MKASPEQQLQFLSKAARLELANLPDEKPTFALRLGWSHNYDDLFAGIHSETDENGLLNKLLQKGKVLIAGRGGGGKTHLLYRTMKRAAAVELIPIFIDLKKWSGADYERWKDWTAADLSEGASFLIERFSSPKISALELDWIPPTAKKLLVVDGLNELSANVGQQILHALNEISTDQVQTYVIVADRLVRRQLPSERSWALSTILPFSEEQIRSYSAGKVRIPNDSRMLEIPFFLNAAIKGDLVSGGRAAISSSFLRKHSGLTEHQLDQLAKFALDAYLENKARTFTFDQLLQSTGPEVAHKILAARIVEKLDDGLAYFSHHLVHDYLVARHLAGQPATAWTRDTLNAVSFDRSSFDVTALVLGLLKGQQASLFLRTLYDWDLYAAGYAMAEADTQGDGPAEEMRALIFAMLAEKRFDVVMATRQRANDALLIYQSPDAIPYRAATDLQRVFDAIGMVDSTEDWFNEWRRLFLKPLGSPLDDESLDLILDTDSVKGWTIANVAKRTHLSSDQQSRLRSLLAQDETVVRWRVAHALGSFPGRLNFEALIRVLDHDLEGDVRYGAIRSLIEMASYSDPELRDAIAAEIERGASKISADIRVAIELSRALLIDFKKAPKDWLRIVKMISRAMFQSTEDPANRDVWRSVSSRAEVLYDQDRMNLGG